MKRKKAREMALELAEQIEKLTNVNEAHEWGIKVVSIIAQIKKASPEAFAIVLKVMEAKNAEFENVL